MKKEALQETLKQHSRLRSTPGQKYGYSNISYWLLGKAIESVSGKIYSAYVKENVFGPLGISPSAASFQIENHGIHATGYQKAFSVQGLLLYLFMDRRMLGETVKV